MGRLLASFFLLLLAHPAFGAISVDATVSRDQAIPRTGISVGPFSTARNSELLLAFIAADYRTGGNTVVRRVTGAGLTWVLVVRTNTEVGTAEIWRAFAPTVLTGVSVTATLSQPVAASLTVMTFAGVNAAGTSGDGAIGATGSGTSSSGAPTATLVTTHDGSWVFGVGNAFGRAVGRTPGPDQYLVHQYLAPVKGAYWVQGQEVATPLGGTAVTINDTAPTSERYNLSICEIVPASSGATTTRSLSGTVTPAAVGSGTTLTLSGTAAATATADASGNYMFTGLAPGPYSVTPSKTGYAFSPVRQTVTIGAEDQAGVSFVAQAASTAIWIDATVSKDQGTASTTITTTGFSTTLANELLLAFVAADYRTGANTVVSAISGAGLTWAQVVRTNVQSGTAEIWRAFAPSALSNVSVTATLSQAVAASLTVMTFAGVDPSGVNGAGAIGAIGSGSGASGGPTAKLLTTRNNSWVFGVGNDFDNAVGRTPGSGQYLVHQYLAPIGDTYWVQGQNSGTTPGGTGVTVNDSAPTTDRYNLSICEVLPAPAGGASPLWSLAGTVSPAAIGSGVTVKLSGAASALASANASGTYTFAGLPNGTYTVTPVRTDYTFSPASQSVSIDGANRTDVNFTASAVPSSWNLSGTVNPASAGNGTTLTLSGTTSATATADASGNYMFTGLATGTYTVTPSKTGYRFSPASQTMTLSGVDQTGVNFTASAGAAPNLVVDPSQAFQTVDGMGTNINVNSWNGGQLSSALDYLVDANGSSLFRVIRDPMTWVNSESLIPSLHALDPAALQGVYETPAMQDLWSTLGYLNRKGVNGRKIILNFMGWTPTWLGGSGRYGVASSIAPGKESAFATMVASLVYYAKRVKGLDFTYLSPLNEQDLDGKEGPLVAAGQYASIMHALAGELDAMGLGDIRFVAPDTAIRHDAYIGTLEDDSAAWARTDRLTAHSYSSAITPGAADRLRPYWVTETALWCSSCDGGGAISASEEWGFARGTTDIVLDDLALGQAAVLIWEGFDSFWYHHNAMSRWGLLGYDGAAYTPRKRFFANAQVNRFIRPGARRLGVSTSTSSLEHVVAFSDPTSDATTIVGHNTNTSPLTITGQVLNGTGGNSVLKLYYTNAAADFQRGPDVTVTAGSFVVTIPPDTLFTLTNQM